MWKFVKERKPGFVLNAVLPNANMGEILSDKQPASTGEWVKQVYNGNLDDVKDIPPQWSKQSPSPSILLICHSESQGKSKSGLTPPQLNLQ